MPASSPVTPSHLLVLSPEIPSPWLLGVRLTSAATSSTHGSEYFSLNLPLWLTNQLRNSPAPVHQTSSLRSRGEKELCHFPPTAQTPRSKDGEQQQPGAGAQRGQVLGQDLRHLLSSPANRAERAQPRLSCANGPRGRSTVHPSAPGAQHPPLHSPSASLCSPTSRAG